LITTNREKEKEGGRSSLETEAWWPAIGGEEAVGVVPDGGGVWLGRVRAFTFEFERKENLERSLGPVWIDGI
jgi:hypothetical protein